MSSSRHDDAGSGSPASPAARWAFLGIISAGLFLIAIDNSVLYTALPVLRVELGASELQNLWILNAYPLVMSGLLLGTGTLGDKLGHRKMFLIGLVVFTAASLLAAFSPEAWFLVAARVLLGFGAATMMPATLALIRQTFVDSHELSIAIGVWAGVATAGAAAGPVLGGLLLEHFWWGSIFLINVPIALLAILGVILFAPPNVANPYKKWDLRSSALALVALTGLTMTIREAANPNRNLWLLAVSVLAAILGGVVFARRQRRLDDPLLTFDIFRNPLFLGGTITAIGGQFVTAGMALLTTQRFQLAGGFSPLQVGSMALISAVAAIPFSLSGGALLDRLGFRTLITGGFVLMAAGVTGMTGFFLAGWMPGFLASIAFVGAGAGAAMSVSSTAIVGAAPRHRAGMASGVEEVSYEFGHLTAVSVVGSLLPLAFVTVGRIMGHSLPANAADALADPALHDQAAGAYDGAYAALLAAIVAIALVLAALTAWFFRGNPTSKDLVNE